MISRIVTVTQEQVNKLRHALGADKAKRGVAFRNYYCSAADDPDMTNLVAQGLMFGGPAINEGRDRYRYYYATAEGMAFVGIKAVSR